MNQRADTVQATTRLTHEPAATRRAAKPRGFARTAGLLLVTAAFVLPLSGALALDVDPALPLVDTSSSPAAAGLTTPLAPGPPAETDDPAPTQAQLEKPAISTGDRLDADERQAFLDWVAAQKAAGQHRGVAVYASW